MALLITGSGPTDRDGNGPGMKKNGLKMLAAKLSKDDVTSLRYDKRVVGRSRQVTEKEANRRLERSSDNAEAELKLS